MSKVPRIWITTGVSVAVGALVLLLLWPVTGRGGSSRHTRAISNLKQQALAVALYAADFDGVTPAAASWMDLLKPYTKYEAIFDNPRVTEASPLGFGFHRAMGSRSLDEVDRQENLVLIFETRSPSRNLNGGREIALPFLPEFQSFVLFAFTDTSVRSIQPAAAWSVDWTPQAKPKGP